MEIKPKDGAIENIAKLTQEHELYVITSRPYFIEHLTISWLDKHFPQAFKDVYHTNQFSTDSQKTSKSEICLKTGSKIILEDAPNYAYDCLDHGIKVLLFTMPWNQHLKPLAAGITRINHWSEVPDALLKYTHG